MLLCFVYFSSIFFVIFDKISKYCSCVIKSEGKLMVNIFGYMSKTVTNFLIDFSTVFFWIALVGYFFFVALVVNFFHFCLLHEQHPCSCGLLIKVYLKISLG